MNRGAQPGPAGEGAITRAFRERLRATPPDVMPGIDGVPAFPPQIPGLADLVAVGRGGTGIVYRARDITTAETVAVKVLLAAAALSPSARARARREGEILATLDHPNIVRVLSSGELRSSPGWPDGVPYLVMEWLAGGTLQRLSGERALPAPEAARMVRDLTRVLEKVHGRGIVHRDLKPANVVLVEGAGEAGPLVPKLVDFGLARDEQGATGLTPSSGVIGTPEYMAPEQAGVNDPLVMVSPATDIHGLGGILFFLLFGRAPYDAKTVPEAFARVVAGNVDWPTGWTQQLSADLRTILETCLERLPARRYPSAGALADDLDRFLDGRPIAARRRPWLERVAREIGRHPVVAVAALLGGLFVATWGVGLWTHTARLEQVRQSAAAAEAVTRASLERLSGDALKRMMARGPALDGVDLAYLRGVRTLLRESPSRAHPPVDLLFRIDGLRRLAAVFSRTERIDDAIESLQEAIAACGELETLKGQRDVASTLRFEILREESTILINSNRIAAAEPVLRKALGIGDGWPRPLSTERQVAINEARTDLAYAISRLGRSDEALGIFAEALVDMRRTSESHPDHVGCRIAELVALCNAAAVSQQAGRAEERRERLREVVRLADAAIERYPTEREDFTKKLVFGLATLADAEADEGRFEESLATTRRLQAEVRAGLEAFADKTHFRGEAIEAAIREAVAFRGLHRPDAALGVLESALEDARRQVAEEPAVFVHAQRLVKTCHHLGLLHEQAGRPAAAIETYQGIIEAFEPWREALDRLPVIRQLCAGAHGRIGTLLRLQGDPAGAVKRYQQALADADPPQRPPILIHLAATAVEVGDTAVARQAAEEALLDPSAATAAHQILNRIPD